MRPDRCGRRRADPRLPAFTEPDYLLAVDDFSRVGALRLGDAGGAWHRAVAKGRRDAPPPIEMERIYQASRAVERGQESPEGLRYLQRKGASLGGMRPQCTMIDDGWLAIGKLPSVGDARTVPRGEVPAPKPAAQAGIDAVPARIVLLGDEESEAPVAVIRRFGRDNDDDRTPYQSAASLLQASRKVDRSYTEFADAIRSLSHALTEDVPAWAPPGVQSADHQRGRPPAEPRIPARGTRAVAPCPCL